MKTMESVLERHVTRARVRWNDRSSQSDLKRTVVSESRTKRTSPLSLQGPRRAIISAKEESIPTERERERERESLVATHSQTTRLDSDSPFPSHSRLDGGSVRQCSTVLQLPPRRWKLRPARPMFRKPPRLESRALDRGCPREAPLSAMRRARASVQTHATERSFWGNTAHTRETALRARTGNLSVWEINGILNGILERARAATRARRAPAPNHSIHLHFAIYS